MAKANKSPPWQIEELEAVLKFLKNNKSKDPIVNINELFKPNIVCDDLKNGILLLMNKIKESNMFPGAF